MFVESLTKSLPASEQRLEVYCQAQEQDEVLVQVREYRLGEEATHSSTTQFVLETT